MGKQKSQEHESPSISIVARNRKARHDFEILEAYEAGISLIGGEVKSLRSGKLTLSEAYATVVEGEVILKNLHIPPYLMASDQPAAPNRDRRLLLHKREIRKITKSIEEKGLTLIPLTVYFKGALVKIELAVARGRKKYDKREEIARRESEREMKRATKRSP